MGTEIQEYRKTEQALITLREDYANTVYAVDTTKGMKQARAARGDIRSYRIGLEEARKKAKGPALKRCRDIDADAKRITEELVALESPIADQIKSHEAKLEAARQAKIDAEAKRVEDIQVRINEIRNAVVALSRMGAPTSETIREVANDVEQMAVDDTMDEFEQEAAEAKEGALDILKDLLAAAVGREEEAAKIQADRKELDRLRAIDEKREADREAKRVAEEATATKKREAEEKAEREKLEAQRAAQAAEQKKIDDENKLLADAREKLESDQREAEAKIRAAEADERDRKKMAQEAAERAIYPGAEPIIAVIADHFEIPQEVAKAWLLELLENAIESV